MSLRNVRTIFFKELRDIARDRRALTFMIVLPIAIVPVLMIGMGQLMEFGKRKLLEEPSRVAILGGARAPVVADLLRSFESPAALLTAPPALLAGLMDEAGAADSKAVGKVLGDGADLAKVAILKVVEAPGDIEATEEAIRKKDLDAAVVVPDGFSAALAGDRTTEVTIEYDSSVDRSKIAYRKLRQLFRAFDRGIVLERLPRHGIDISLIDPIRIEDHSVASKEQEGRAILSLILPYLLILMCFSGAVYPAIDLGAGEKERGTLETLLVCPAERSEIVSGKFLVIFATSLVAALLNIASLGITISSGLFSGELAEAVPLSVDPASAAVALVLMLPVAAIFASVLLSVSIFAKSFKEAQAYFVPFNMLIILPAFFSLIPGVELDLGLSLIPIVNVSLAIKETLAGTYKWGCLLVIFGSTAAIAAASVAFSALWFRREQVLFRS